MPDLPDLLDTLDYDNDVPDDLPRQDDEAITAHGYDSRSTPVDTLMNAPVQMHLDYGDDLIFGDYP